MNRELILEACKVLEDNYNTGVSVMRATIGKWSKIKAQKVVIEAARKYAAQIKEED